MRMGIRRQDVPFAPGRYTLGREDHFLLHDLQISEMFTRAQLGARERGMELLWFNEAAAILRAGEEEIVRPDGMGVVMGQEREIPFFVEMDRGNTEWAHKVAAYERARRQSSWQQALQVDGWQPADFPPVLCVTPAALAKKALTTIGQQRGQVRFYLKTWEAFLASDIGAGWYDIRQEKVETLLPLAGGEENGAL